MNRKKKYVVINMKHFLLLIPVFFLFGCSLYDSAVELSVNLPADIPEVFENRGYKWVISRSGEDGEIYTEELENGSGTMILRLQKGEISSVSVHLIIDLPNRKSFKSSSAGFLYPFDFKSGEMSQFTWYRGFESDLLLQLGQEMDINNINFQRLSSTIEEVSGGDSSCIDGNLIAENLLSGEFRIYDIRKKRGRLVEVHIPDGIWFPEYLYKVPITSVSIDVPMELNIYPGFNRFLSNSGMILDIDLKKDGAMHYIIY